MASLAGYSSAVHLRAVEDDVETFENKKIIKLEDFALAEITADSNVSLSDTTIVTETILQLSQEDQGKPNLIETERPHFDLSQLESEYVACGSTMDWRYQNQTDVSAFLTTGQ